jgi:hypothetical protein
VLEVVEDVEPALPEPLLLVVEVGVFVVVVDEEFELPQAARARATTPSANSGAMPTRRVE